MTTWILILTLAGTGPGSNGGVSIHSVPGFISSAACRAAGDSWLRGFARDTIATPTAVCVQQDQPQQPRVTGKLTGVRL